MDQFRAGESQACPVRVRAKSRPQLKITEFWDVTEMASAKVSPVGGCESLPAAVAFLPWWKIDVAKLRRRLQT